MVEKDTDGDGEPDASFAPSPDGGFSKAPDTDGDGEPDASFVGGGGGGGGGGGYSAPPAEEASEEIENVNIQKNAEIPASFPEKGVDTDGDGQLDASFAENTKLQTSDSSKGIEQDFQSPSARASLPASTPAGEGVVKGSVNLGKGKENIEKRLEAANTKKTFSNLKQDLSQRKQRLQQTKEKLSSTRQSIDQAIENLPGETSETRITGLEGTALEDEFGDTADRGEIKNFLKDQKTQITDTRKQANQTLETVNQNIESTSQEINTLENFIQESRRESRKQVFKPDKNNTANTENFFPGLETQPGNINQETRTNFQTQNNDLNVEQAGENIRDKGLQIMDRSEKIGKQTEKLPNINEKILGLQADLLQNNRLETASEKVGDLEDAVQRGGGQAFTAPAGLFIGGTGAFIDIGAEEAKTGEKITEENLREAGSQTKNLLLKDPLEQTAEEIGEETVEAGVGFALAGGAGAVAGATPTPTVNPEISPEVKNIETPENFVSDTRDPLPEDNIDNVGFDDLPTGFATESQPKVSGREQIRKMEVGPDRRTGKIGQRNPEPVPPEAAIKETPQFQEAELSKPEQSAVVKEFENFLNDFRPDDGRFKGELNLETKQTTENIDTTGRDLSQNFDQLNEPAKNELSDNLLGQDPTIETEKEKSLNTEKTKTGQKQRQRFFIPPFIETGLDTRQPQNFDTELDTELDFENEIKQEPENEFENNPETTPEPVLEQKLKFEPVFEPRPEPETKPEKEKTPRIKGLTNNDDNFLNDFEDEESAASGEKGRFAESLTAGLFNIQADEEFDKDQTFTGLDIRPLI